MSHHVSVLSLYLSVRITPASVTTTRHDTNLDCQGCVYHASSPTCTMQFHLLLSLISRFKLFQSRHIIGCDAFDQSWLEAC